tara:strand:- start:106902 stop:107435 length:534 start_codon:yes stop_codon:yes gene_type:complete
LQSEQRLTHHPTTDVDASWATTLDPLHTTDFQIAMVVSGGGSRAIGRCFQRPGASRSFVEAVVPYSHAAMCEYLNEPPAGPSASVETAIQLSRVAMERCRRLSDNGINTSIPVGISLVAALPTSEPRKGQDRIHVALNVNGSIQTWTRQLPRGEFTRDAAERVAEAMFLSAMGELLR